MWDYINRNFIIGKQTAQVFPKRNPGRRAEKANKRGNFKTGAKCAMECLAVERKRIELYGMQRSAFSKPMQAYRSAF